ncbi:MAG: DNA recombination protein RmuC [Thermotogae bacterium]|nr:DNA recombination protein RmuC [Thermotogota bacterium]
MSYLLLVLFLVLLCLNLVILVRLKKLKVESSMIDGAVLKAWKESGLDRRLGEISTHAAEIKELHKSIEQMLRVPSERGSFGEMALETILADQLPPDMYGIRQRVLDGRIPDAFIRSTAGIICIDSKFPLDNYRNMLQAREPKEEESYRKRFLRNVEEHLKKVLNDYVKPEKGSADFAFVFVPSEGVYWFLVKEAFDLLREYSKKGVQLVSPLTLSHKIELIKAGVHARKLSEEAEQVKRYLLELARHFEELERTWNVFYKTHLRNLTNKAEELKNVYDKLSRSFDDIRRNLRS